MSNKISIATVSAYSFHMVEQPQQLNNFGVLERFVTAAPRSRTGLPKSLTRNRLVFSGVRHYGGKIVPSLGHSLNWLVIRDFDLWAIKQLGLANIINSLSRFATNTLKFVSERGLLTCCDRGSWHILEKKKVLDDEAQRLGINKTYFDPWIVDRELEDYETVDRIFEPSEPALQSFIKRGVNPAKISKVPCGVDISRFKVPGGPRQRSSMLSVGTVGMQKGHHLLVNAYRSLKSRSASLTFVGPIDPNFEDILDISRGDIRVTGALNRDGVVRELQNADMFVLASIQEGLALVIVQTMACGLPIIATEATGVREQVDEFEKLHEEKKLS